MSDSAKRPNVLFLMTDQQRFDQIGYASGGFFETPNLDRLARDGVIFDTAYSSSTVCVPARGSLLTGLQPHRYPKQLGDKMAIQEGRWNLAFALREAGYQTATIGKGHFSPIHARLGFDRMRMVEHMNCYPSGTMDDYLTWLLWEGKADSKATHIEKGSWGEKDREYWRYHTAVPFPYDQQYHPTSWTAAESIKFLKERDPNKPFFLMTSFMHPHAPFDPPEPYASMYDPAQTEIPKDGMEVNAGLPPRALALMHGANFFGYNPVSKVGEEPARRILTYIRALIRQIDDAVGRILEHVDLDNTIVFFTTDHGDFSGHRGLLLKTPFFPFDDLARVPLFCRGPGIPRGRRLSHCVQSADIALTCLDLLGVAPPPVDFDTASLKPLFADTLPGDDRIVYTASSDGYPMVRRREVKYFRDLRGGEEMLFDLAKDPGETVNRIGEPAYAGVAAELRAHMQGLLAKGVADLPPFDGAAR